MATPPIPPGHITKSQAARRYKRAYRNIGKDLSAALAMRDEAFLQHCKLLTKDGKLREGIEVTPDVVLRLRDDGMNPTWMFVESFMDTRYRQDRSPVSDQSDEVATGRTLPIKDAEVVEASDDNGSGDDEDATTLALFKNPLLQMQARTISDQNKRIIELETDRTSDREVIATLREALALVSEETNRRAKSTQPHTREGVDENEDTKAKKRKTRSKKKKRESSKRTWREFLHSDVSELTSFRKA